MARNGPVTRADLPQFTVASVEEGERNSDGLIEWRLHGRLNRVEGVTLHGWSYLLLPGKGSLTGDFILPQGESHQTKFTAWDRSRPDVEGLSLACMDGYFNPYVIWMIEDGPEAWSERIFAASDAIADNFVGTDGKTYRRIRKAEAAETERASGESQGPTWMIPGGWDHEHCAICMAHIDPGDCYFFHAGYNQFLCVACYQEYVLTGSIAFALPPDEQRSNGEDSAPE